jgi:hypothetical protein
MPLLDYQTTTLHFHGLRVTTTVWLTKWVPRTRRERWLSWPWQPWIRTKEVPSDEVLQLTDRLVVHPLMLPRLKAVLEEQSRGPA